MEGFGFCALVWHRLKVGQYSAKKKVSLRDPSDFPPVVRFNEMNRRQEKLRLFAQNRAVIASAAKQSAKFCSPSSCLIYLEGELQMLGRLLRCARNDTFFLAE